MRLLGSTLRWTLWGLAALLAILAVFLAERLSWLPGSLAPLSGETAMDNLGGEVRIIRDRNDVPHITGASEEDVFFGLGFAHAQDRLWQMESARRLIKGRLAEIVGPSAVPIDTYFRAIDLEGRARDSLNVLEPATLRILESYAAGVNAWAREESRRAPEFHLLMTGFEPWQSADSLLIVKYFSFSYSENAGQEILRARLAKVLDAAAASELFPGRSASDPITLRDAANVEHAWLGDPFARLFGAGQGASNNWVVDGRFTASGLPLLANDPHTDLAAPGTWYLVHLNLPQGDVVGATIAGVPAVVLGHNGHVAWGFTNTGPDTEDVVFETVDPDDPQSYLTPAGSVPFKERASVINTRFWFPALATLRETRSGPVLPAISDALKDALPEGTVAAMASVAFSRKDATLEAAMEIAAARSVREGIDAFRKMQAPMQNIVLADTGGSIGFVAPGRIPIRAAGADGLLPADGKTLATLWTGYAPFESLPQIVDPPAGKIYTANNQIVPDDYPVMLTASWFESYRAQRIGELLRRGAPYDVAAFSAMQMDSYAPDAAELLPLLLAVPLTGERERRAAETLKAWTYGMAADRSEPLIFMAWARQLQRLLVEDELGDIAPSFLGLRTDFARRVLANQRGMAHWCDDVMTEERVETCDEIAARALTAGLDELEAAYGRDMSAWRWGRAHRALFAHPVFGGLPLLNRYFNRCVPVSGGSNTLNRSDMIYAGARPFESIFGTGFRAVYDLSDPPRSRFMLAIGQSGNPLSPYYDNFLEAWAAGETFEIPIDEAQYTDGAIGTWLLRPE